MNNLIITKSNYGSSYKIYLEGEKDPIKQFYTRAHNFGWIRGKLDWRDEWSASFFITKKNYPKLKVKAFDVPAQNPKKYIADDYYVDETAKEEDSGEKVRGRSNQYLDTIVSKFRS